MQQQQVNLNKRGRDIIMKTTLAKLTYISLVFATCLFLFSSCIRKKGDLGKVVTKNIPVEKFQKLEVAALVPVHIIQGKKCSIKVKGQERLLSYLDFDVIDGKLTVQIKNPDSVFGQVFFPYSMEKVNSNIEIYITAPTLTHINLYGSNPIIFSDSITLDNLIINSDFGCNVTINKMRINQLNFVIADDIGINIKSLTAKQANFDISGNGKIRLNSGHIDNTSFSIAGNADLKIRNLTAKKARFAVPGNAGLDVNFNRTDTASFYIMGNADGKVTGTTRQPIQMITEGKAVIKDETTRIK